MEEARRTHIGILGPTEIIRGPDLGQNGLREGPPAHALGVEAREAASVSTRRHIAGALRLSEAPDDHLGSSDGMRTHDLFLESDVIRKATRDGRPHESRGPWEDGRAGRTNPRVQKET